MAYLVRKLLKRENIDLIGKAERAEDMFADAATSEFRTKGGTLSMWKIDSVDTLDEAVLAIVVTLTKVESMDFIVINTDYLDEENLEYKQTYAGIEIAVADLQNTHFDVVDITIPKLINCTCVYRKVFDEDKEEGNYIVRYAEHEIKDLLSKANQEGRLDFGKLNNGIKKAIPLG